MSFIMTISTNKICHFLARTVYNLLKEIRLFNNKDFTGFPLGATNDLINLLFTCFEACER